MIRVATNYVSSYMTKPTFIKGCITRVFFVITFFFKANIRKKKIFFKWPLMRRVEKYTIFKVLYFVIVILLGVR